MRFKLVENIDAESVEDLWEEAKKVAIEYCNRHPFKYSFYIDRIIRLEIKPITDFGWFDSNKKVIVLSKYLSIDNKEEIFETLLHEFAHAIDTYMMLSDGRLAFDPLDNSLYFTKYDRESKPHNRAWENIARELQKISGHKDIHPWTVTDNRSDNFNKEVWDNYKYIVYCPNCGAKWGYNRKVKIVKEPESFWCTKCGSTKGRLKSRENNV